MTSPFLRLAACCYAFISILALYAFPASAVASQLVVRCSDSSGKPVHIYKVELLFSGWGVAGAVPISHDGELTFVPLDVARLRSLFSDDNSAVDTMFIYIENEGYAPVMSAPIRIGAEVGPIGTLMEAEAAFGSSGRLAVVKPGKKDPEVIVTLRRPVPRFLKLVDDDGWPAAGVEVRSYMYWSSSNHCARLSGVRDLGSFVSGEDGLVEVPDGDFEYAFEVAPTDNSIVLVDPKLIDYPERLVTFLHDETTTVMLHRRDRVTLSMHVTRDGVPAPGETLYGCMADCPGGVCSSCCGPLAETDADGTITLSGFVPEAYEKIYFQDGSGKVLYEASPSKMDLDGVIEVELVSGM